MVTDTRKTPKEQLSRIESDAAYEYRLLRLEFIKAAMQGILSHQNYDFPPEIFAKWAVRHAEATLAAAGGGEGAMTAEVTKISLCDMQVCVPEDWTDEQAERFANNSHMTGLDHGWKLRAADDPAQHGAPIRVQCQKREGHVHIMLSC